MRVPVRSVWGAGPGAGFPSEGCGERARVWVPLEVIDDGLELGNVEPGRRPRSQKGQGQGRERLLARGLHAWPPPTTPRPTRPERVLGERPGTRHPEFFSLRD